MWMRTIQRLALAAAIALAAGAPLGYAQSRGVGVVPIVTKSGEQVGLYKGSYALVIGVGKYTAGWPSLESVPPEMTRLKGALEQQGFQVTKVDDPDASRLERAFKDFIAAHGYDRENRLLVFFSGHGHTRQVGSQPKGYLVPSDAPDPRQDDRGFVRKALPMDQIQTWAREIEAKHVLFLFDSCFSGTIFKTRALGDAPPDISAKTAKPVRQFITAGSANEPVPATSVFLPSVIRGLEGEADLDHDGFVTGTELGEYLQKQVMGYRTGQTPQAGKIRDPDLDEGDFVFPVAKAKAALTPPAKGPSASGFKLDDLAGAAAQEETSRKAWAGKLAEMKQAAGQVEALEAKTVSPQIKQQGWERFLTAFAEKNPYSSEDETLRERARGRVAYWQGEQGRQAQEQQRVADEQRRQAQEQERLAAEQRRQQAAVVAPPRVAPGNAGTFGPPDPNGRPGGTLRAVLPEGWAGGLSPHEASTISTVWPAAPVFNNLVAFDPFRPSEDSDHLVAELAETWTSGDQGQRLTFNLRRGVTWHDGRPFTARDVKFTFDAARGASDQKLRLNPRKEWWANIRDITTNGDYSVTFQLNRPEPGLLSQFASMWAPIYPAHVPLQDMRIAPVGTGPFVLKEAKQDEQLLLVKNPNYFIKGRPYLDGIAYYVIRNSDTRIAAMQANQIDIFFPGVGTTDVRGQLNANAPRVVVNEVAQGVQDNIILNHKRAPFDNPQVRLAVNYSLDRAGFIKTVRQGAGVLGAANLPPPFGKWGLTEGELTTLPGYGDPSHDKAEARRLLAAAGYGPSNLLHVTVTTRNTKEYVDAAIWLIEQLRQVGIQGQLEQIEPALWFPRLVRRDYQIATNITGAAVDDPDANFFENYACGSLRNYTDYCNREVESLMARMSSEMNPSRRLQLTHQIDKQLQLDSARPVLAHRLDYFPRWPQVKNLVPHHGIYNWGRMQDVWLDK